MTRFPAIAHAPARLTVSGTVLSLQDNVDALTVVVQQNDQLTQQDTQMKVHAIFGLNILPSWRTQELPSVKHFISFTGDLLGVENKELAVAIDDVSYSTCTSPVSNALLHES